LNKKTILLVDENKYIQQLKILLEDRYNLIVQNDKFTIYEITQKQKIDLILYDSKKAIDEGLDICKYTNGVPLIFTILNENINSIENLYLSGGIDYILKPYTKNELLIKVKSNIKLHSKNKPYSNHLKRIAAYSEVLSKNYSLSDNDIKIIKEVSPLYDIGNIGISKELLDKPSKFTKEEYEIMKQHARLGYEMLKGSTKEYLKDAAIIAYEHHEKWDGTGYPNGLKGEQIHIFGRIIAAADVFDALGKNKPYKDPLSDEEIIEFFKKESGKHFEPKIVDILIKNIDEMFKIRDKFNDI